MDQSQLELGWDPEVDTPATIAVLGGGMLAVEAALYARFLGYSVLLIDRGKIGDRLLAWGDLPLTNAEGSGANWGEVTTPLGLAALQAQHGEQALPPLDEPVTYRQYVERYLLPVARTDLLHDFVQVHSVVRSISRLGCMPIGRQELASCSLEQRSELLFRVMIDARNRGEYSQLCDVVLDCSEAGGERAGLAFGGGLAIGESRYAEEMLHGKIDVFGKLRNRLADKHNVLFGGGWEACATALQLAALIRETEATRFTWVLPKRWGKKGFSFAVDDCNWTSAGATGPLAQQRLAELQHMAEQADPRMVMIGAWGIEAVDHRHAGHDDHDHDHDHDHHDHDHHDRAHAGAGPDARQQTAQGQGEDQWNIRLQTKSEETIDINGDVLINCTQPIARRLHAEMLDVRPLGGAASLMTAEPHYYVLGNDHGQLLAGEVRDRIRIAFGLIGGRRELDLYATVKPR